MTFLNSRSKNKFLFYVLLHFCISIIIILIIFIAVNFSQQMGEMLPRLFYIKSSLAVNFLSTLSKIQATIFGLFLSINFVIIQQYIPYTYTSPLFLPNILNF